MDPPVTTLTLFQIEQAIINVENAKLQQEQTLAAFWEHMPPVEERGPGKADTRAPGPHSRSGRTKEGSHPRARIAAYQGGLHHPQETWGKLLRSPLFLLFF
ncbi:unnamed protein product [Lathyrus oleraceus]